MQDAQHLIERISRDEAPMQIDQRSAYVRSYPEFLRYFRDLEEIELHHLIIAANFIYGWMPRTLRFKTATFAEAVCILNWAKVGNLLTDADLRCLIALIDNSMVAVSKLLHFINPEQYAIWDSRVAAYLRGSFVSLPAYLGYLELCRSVTAHPAFTPVHDSINEKVGYVVTKMRAVELVMYATGGPKVIAQD